MLFSFMGNGKHIPELRHTRRFPLELSLAVDGESEVRRAVTHDISAGGVLFHLDSDITVGAQIDFTLSMPAAELGTPQDVQVKCMGRVVRCEQEGEQHAVAVVIDEYQFERA